MVYPKIDRIHVHKIATRYAPVMMISPTLGTHLIQYDTYIAVQKMIKGIKIMKAEWDKGNKKAIIRSALGDDVANIFYKEVGSAIWYESLGKLYGSVVFEALVAVATGGSVALAKVGLNVGSKVLAVLKKFDGLANKTTLKGTPLEGHKLGTKLKQHSFENKGQARFTVTEDGVAIPNNLAELKSNLDLLEDLSTNPSTSRKFVGPDSQGAIRVRVEKAHSSDPLHTVDHLHIDRRKGKIGEDRGRSGKIGEDRGRSGKIGEDRVGD